MASPHLKLWSVNKHWRGIGIRTLNPLILEGSEGDLLERGAGKHGLPLFGFADWNDTVNLPTGAESLFMVNLYGWALREFIALLEYLGQPAKEYRAAYDEMRARIEIH